MIACLGRGRLELSTFIFLQFNRTEMRCPKKFELGYVLILFSNLGA